MLLYGGESWVLTSDLSCQLDSFQTSCLGIILGFSRTDHVSNEEVSDRTGTVPLSQPIKAWQIRFLGHCLQRPQEDLISNCALCHPTHGKPRPRGHKILFYECATKLINPENPPFLTKFILWHRTTKLRGTWRSTVGTTGNPHDRLSRAGRGIAGLKLGQACLGVLTRWSFNFLNTVHCPCCQQNSTFFVHRLKRRSAIKENPVMKCLL